MTARYVALLRGVNVGSARKVPMADLKHLFVDLGHDDVTTYIQSGNVVFRLASAKPAAVIAELEKAIAKEFNVPARVLLRTDTELEKVLSRNPFLEKGADPAKLHVTFLADPAESKKAGAAEVPAGETDEFAVGPGRTEVYVHCPNGYGRSKLNNTFFEKKLGVAATTRNWNTVNKLLELARG